LTETFIGGFMSGLLSRGFLGLRVGYGFYFTTARIFGVDPGSHGGSELTGAMGGFIDGQLMPSLPADENEKLIDQLERVKDLFSRDPRLERTYFTQVVDSFAGFAKMALGPRPTGMKPEVSFGTSYAISSGENLTKRTLDLVGVTARLLKTL